jgi:flagellar motor switch protein FliN/FliY
MRRSAGENIDVLAGEALVAFGEIVIIESSMGVRITDFNLQE